MPFILLDQNVGVQVIGTVDTTQQHSIGRIARAWDPLYGGGEFIYLPGVAGLVAGDVVTYDQYNKTVTRWAGVANTGDLLAVASATAPVAGQFGWFQVQGVAPVNVTGTVAAGDRAFYGATATMQSAAVAGKQALTFKAVTASGVPAAGQAVYQFSRPNVQGQIT